MIDLDILEFSLGVAESSGDKTTAIYCASLRELITRLREAEKDAERWRMALSKHENDRDGFEMVELKSSSHFLSFADVTTHIDYEIDQAMKEKCDE